MATVRFSLESALPPEAVLGAATDFSQRRPEVWSRIDPARYVVHAIGEGWAEVTEGSSALGGMWARERYEWSEPATVRGVVQASDVFRPGSTWKLHVEPAPGGGSLVRWESVRQGIGKGRIVTAMMRLTGAGMFRGYLREVLDRLEREGASA